MKKRIQRRALLILATVFLSIIFFLPSTPLYSSLPGWWQRYLPSRGVNLGLDLQGGMHLVLEVEGEKAIAGMIDRTAPAMKRVLEEKKVSGIVGVDRIEEGIRVRTADASTRTAAEKLVSDNFPTFRLVRESESEIVFAPKESEVSRVLDSSTSQALETIRNRVDQFGVAEPLIQKQGAKQILVQLPGVKNPQRAIELIGKTALLEFKLIDEESPVGRELPVSIPPEEEEKVFNEFSPKVPAGGQILFERRVNRETGRVTKTPLLVKKEAALTGDLLSDARVAFDNFNQSYVSITFDATGAKIFERVTGENVKRRLAIVLDNTVYSAPVIQDRISGGRAQISGSFTTEEASDLAIVLRAGALPAPVKIIQNVTVGPSLGRDSIDHGMKAGIVGTVLVGGFMIFYYRLSGVIADFTLVFNMILLIGALAALNATLTLPGIAGIILTIGMSVDSNVLIFERIREELRSGKPPRLAVDAGYSKAFVTIFDSHVTTLITAFVLFLFGTGPIKGFAVTLSLGVIINLFTSLIGTKVVFDLVNLRRLERLSI